VDVLDLHARLATALLLYLVVLAAWGLLLASRGAGPSPSYNGALVIVELAIVAQGLLGGATWLVRAAGPPWIHALYGFALVLTVPLAATIARDGSPRRAALTFGVASLFAAGLVIRGMTTA
jgi:hypothetical protein